MPHEEYATAKKYIMDTYGVGEAAFLETARSRTYDPDSGVYTNLWQLYDDLTEQAAGSVARLASAGYDYEDMEEYVRRLEAEEQARARDQRAAEFVSERVNNTPGAACRSGGIVAHTKIRSRWAAFIALLMATPRMGAKITATEPLNRAEGAFSSMATQAASAVSPASSMPL